MNKKLILPIILLVVCIGGIVYAAMGIVKETSEIKKAETVSSVFSEFSPSEALFCDETESGAALLSVLDSFRPKLEAMQAQNSDIIGWIYIPQTHIDYPLLQGSDNKFYLTHGADKRKSAAGCVFVDKNGFAENTIIYGHNMGRSSNVIFHDITNFSDKAWFEKARYGYIITADSVTEINFFAYALTKPETQFYSSVPDLEYIKNNSMHYRDIYSGGDVITLSTCAYDYKNARALLIGETTVLE